MNKINNTRLIYSDEDLKILKKAIQKVKKLNFNKENQENNKKIKAIIQRKVA